MPTNCRRIILLLSTLNDKKIINFAVINTMLITIIYA